ncbi:hypothetical protein [Paraburkholderia sp. BL10I2N1]|uniref:hypothetical protein n=1 Tax=Paraburkholderia sp. BL10I2N1 TaxID=1938796 RepID=UPI00105FB448|nr:hypothetical protein [Paraburkholderia sp. BL10I2N1]TDN70403.1 hypothetical protein B0G77_3876 [Paraburkholderia sp. BL10I2N1]
MSISLEDFVAKTGAEMVGGRLVLGIQEDRRIVGDAAPTFTLNEEGLLIASELEEGIAAEQAIADAKAKAKK